MCPDTLRARERKESVRTWNMKAISVTSAELLIGISNGEQTHVVGNSGGVSARGIFAVL